MASWLKPKRRRIYLACFVAHFLVIVTVSCRESVWLVARGLTLLPSPLRSYSERIETRLLSIAPSNAVRSSFLTYLHAAGIERAYGYFAPNVPASYRLVFELHYPDGQTEYALPLVTSAAANLRLASLLDEIGRTRHGGLREYLVKMLAASVWNAHPEVTTMRAIFESLKLPTVAEFEAGERGTYDFLYVYDFSRRVDPP
ncbi:MAG: hypothetical protein ABJB69_01030 [Spartobacteria bacterium]